MVILLREVLGKKTFKNWSHSSVGNSFVESVKLAIDEGCPTVMQAGAMSAGATPG